jgi:hypothetical protein
MHAKPFCNLDQRRRKWGGTRATGAVLAANDSRPVWSVFAVVIGELNESADQQLFNSIHGSFPAGFADVFAGHPVRLRRLRHHIGCSSRRSSRTSLRRFPVRFE